MKKKVLILGYGNPSYGGAATTMFNLEKILRKEFETKLIYFTNNNILGSELHVEDQIIKINTSENILRKIYYYLKYIYIKLCKLMSIKTHKPKVLGDFINKIRPFFFFDRSKRELKQFLLDEKFSPDILISNIPSYYRYLSSFDIKHKILIVNGSAEMTELAKREVDASSFLNNIVLLNNLSIRSYNFEKLHVIFNSPLTKNIYERLNVRSPNSTVQHFNLTPVPNNNNNNKAFHERKTHLAYIVSNGSRKIKNAGLAIRLFDRYPKINKLCVGASISEFKDLKNCYVHKLMSQNDLYELMNDVRLVIIPSYYDSSPGIMTEAILRGCNVLVSKNIGWNEFLAPECVVNDFTNLDEWADKASHLMNKYQNNNKIIELFNKSPSENINFFKQLT
ncbi:hypothetical protein [Polaribacter sp.]|jgi:glycosyltransferase involved in cell wall biosynthesis|uniref:hypothetical protein n=1 Tax=Polaribacter sp. TaxID=1920175 RepID=UPI003EEA1DDA